MRVALRGWGVRAGEGEGEGSGRAGGAEVRARGRARPGRRGMGNPGEGGRGVGGGVSGGSSVPRLVVFDLDATLWVPEMYELWGGAPWRAQGLGRALSSKGEEVRLMGTSRETLDLLRTGTQFAGTAVAFASRTTEVEAATALIDVMQVADGVTMSQCGQKGTYAEIFPGRKTKHLANLRERTGIPYSSMLFLDNEYANIRDVGGLGVASLHTPHGITPEAWEQGLSLYAERAGGGVPL